MRTHVMRPLNIKVPPRRVLPRQTSLERELQAAAATGGAASIARLGFAVHIVQTPGRGLHRLPHSFFVVSVDSEPYVIDTEFRAQFETPFASTEYAALLEDVPEVVAMRADRLESVIANLAVQLAEQYKARGVALPPWRTVLATLGRWRPALPPPTTTDPAPPPIPLGRPQNPAKSSLTTGLSLPARAISSRVPSKTRNGPRQAA